MDSAADFRWSFVAPWNGHGKTNPQLKDEVLVASSTFSVEDVYVAAGCQKGYLHATTALQLGAMLMRAAARVMPQVETRLSIKVIDPRGGEHLYDAVELRSTSEGWSVLDADGEVMTGPHSHAGYTFSFVINPLVEEAKRLQSLLKGGENK